MKKVLICVCVIIMILSCATFCIACGETNNPTGNSSSNFTPSSITSSRAISIAQQSSAVQNAIAKYYNMKFFYTPDWGTCTAKKEVNYQDEEYWKVTLKGTISGYTDDYKTDFEYDKTFSVTVKVDATTGRILNSYSLSVSRY